MQRRWFRSGHIGMKTMIITLLFALTMLPGCRKEIDAPSCIKAKIDEVKNNPGLYINKVSEYIFRNNTVYVFESEPFPDAASAIYDQNYDTICWLRGISGNMTCQGENFGQKAILVRTVWEK